MHATFCPAEGIERVPFASQPAIFPPRHRGHQQYQCFSYFNESYLIRNFFLLAPLLRNIILFEFKMRFQ